VSKDSTKSHKKFSDKLGLPFALLADTELKMMQDFDVWKEKKLYGKTYMGTDRSTFLIDEDGRILRIWTKVKVKDHVEEVLGALANAK
jgi:peroxiredoxin Q/BCP